MSEVAPAEPLPLPPTALLGEEAITKVTDEIAALVRSQHDPEVVSRAADMIRNLVEVGIPGEPILKLSGKTVDGGYLRTPVHARPNRHQQTRWEIAAVVDGTGHTSGVQHPELRLTIDLLLRIARNLDPSPLVVGREAIRHRLAARWIGVLAAQPPEEAYRPDIKFFAELSRTKLPFADFYPMNSEDQARLVEILRRRILTTSSSSEQAMALEALVYCQGLNSEGRGELLHSIWEELALMLPVRPGEGDMTPIVAAKLFSADYEPSPNLLQGVVATPEIRHAAFLSKLYADLSSVLDDGLPYVPAEVPLVEVAEPPAPRDLFVFQGPTPETEHILADIKYLRELQASGITLDLERDYDYATVKIGVARIMKHILANNDPTERAEAFKALESLYGTNIEPDYLYRLLTWRLALTVPVEAPASLRGYVGAAQTIGDLMPSPPMNEHGQPLPQPARTAAVMSRIYDARAKQLVSKALQKMLFPEDETS